VLYLHSPNAPSWCGGQLGGAQGQLYLYLLPFTDPHKHWNTIATSAMLHNHKHNSEHMTLHNPILVF